MQTSITSFEFSMDQRSRRELARVDPDLGRIVARAGIILARETDYIMGVTRGVNLVSPLRLCWSESSDPMADLQHCAGRAVDLMAYERVGGGLTFSHRLRRPLVDAVSRAVGDAAHGLGIRVWRHPIHPLHFSIEDLSHPPGRPASC